MIQEQQTAFFDETARRIDGPVYDGPGPQGAALILELQKLRHALDVEGLNDPRARAPRADGAARKRPQGKGSPKQRRRKGRVEQAIDICLQPFRSKAPAPAARNAPVRREIRVEPQRQRSAPTVAPKPVPVHLVTPLSEGLHRSMSLDRLDTAVLSGAAKTETGIAGPIERCRTGLTAGVNFILHGSDPAAAADASEHSLAMRTGRAFEHELRTGLRILILAMVLAGGWLVFMPLAGAVVVPGNLVVQSNVKQIQHPTGGVVAEIKVHNGTRVAAGDLLVRLDAVQAQASLQVVTKQLDEIRARIARLVAERDGLAQINFSAKTSKWSNNSDIAKLVASEESLFKARAGARQSQKDLLQSQAAQLAQQITGFESQMDSKARQLELIRGELAGVQDLYDKRLVPLTRLTTLQREAAQLDGERGQLTSSIAETRSKIDASQLQIVRIDQDFRADVVKELGEAQAKEAELAERDVAALDLLDRIEIRAPTSGVVNQLSVHTIGGVIRAGETIMEIVPDTDDLQIEARVEPKDIDHVRTGQSAFVRFTAFNQRTTPQLQGKVSYVSADTGRDQQTSAPYFTVRIVLPEDERRRLNGQQLVAGMPAEVFMQTGSRTMMGYLLEPITDQMRRAFVEP